MKPTFWGVLNVILVILIGLILYVVGYSVAWLLEHTPNVF